MSGHRPSRRSRFVLAGTGAPADAADDHLGGETGVTTSFDGFTIVSAPDDEGRGWMGVEPPRPAVLGRVQQPPRLFSGALSAASSMTDPPTLRSSGPPASRAGGVSWEGGGGRNWSPSTDMHAQRMGNGKLRQIELVFVGAGDRVCLGLIGSGGNRRFCHSRGCKIKAHRKTRFAMQGARGGWFIPVKPTANGGLTAFVEPFLDVNKITEDTKDLLKMMTPRTTADWEKCMLVCHEEWDDLEAQGLDDIEEGEGVGDEDEMEEDDEEEEDHDLWEGNMFLRSPPEDFAWEHDIEDMSSLKNELEMGYPQNTKEAVEELQAAFGDLEGRVAESRRGARRDTSDVLNHLGLGVAEIVTAINRINARGRRMVSLVGSVDVLREETGHHDVTLVEAVLGLEKAMDDLTTTLAEVDEDLVRNCTLLDNKTQVLEKKQRAISNASPSPSSLNMSTPIFDDNGIQVFTLGRLLQDNVDLARSNELLKARIERLSADVIAQGGVTLGSHTFTSEMQLLELCMKECPKGDAISAFVDPMVVFCHDAAYSPLSGWEGITKAMEKSGNFHVTDRKVVASFNAPHCFWFSEGKTVVAGKPLQAFASKEKWQGTGGMDGRRHEIELSLETAADGVRTSVEDKLPDGSRLGQLALRMLEHTTNWFSTVFKHLDSEFVRLTQVNISEEETLILLSEEVIIMFDRFYAIRRKRMDFKVHGSQVEYMVRCIWLSLQVHMVMDKFTANGMKYNSTISAAFMRFLTKVTGGNAAAGMAGTVASLDSKIKNLGNAIKEVKKDAAAAHQRATTANNAADDAKKTLTKLYQANSTLKK